MRLSHSKMQHGVLKHGGGLNKTITDTDGINWLWLITDYYQNLTVSDRIHPSFDIQIL